MDLFEPEEAAPGDGKGVPLADRMRPRTLDEFLGQDEITGEGAPLRRLIREDNLRSLVFWGPPGCGKTTLAFIIARTTKSEFISMSAVTASIKDVKVLMERARTTLARHHRRTILFVDEIHRFNKAQQDAFLPFVEDGSIVLIGATTENPSFSLISALLSRCKIFVLKALGPEHVVRILHAAVADKKRGMGGRNTAAADDVLGEIGRLSDGDARRALNLLELAVEVTPPGEDGSTSLTAESLRQVLQRQHLIYDKSGEEHYNLISAFHKSMRGSDAQAAAYWAGRMLASGEDPLYLARRMIRFASEDIGNADPQALSVALTAREAFTVLGSPEGELALIQCAIYLATAPKSNAAYIAEGRIRQEIEQTGSQPVPFHIRNAPTAFMKNIGYGSGYQYDHDVEGRIAAQEYLPEGVRRRVFYEPGEFGFEREIAKRMEWWEKRRKERGGKKPGDKTG
jgi:putative ATPase